MQNPTTSQLNAAKRILRYVKGSLSHGLWYKRCDTFLLSGFTNANCPGDTHDRRSISGYCFSIGSTVVPWCSNVQIKCDNESAIKLASNPVFHARTKHVEIRHHFVHEKVLSEEIELTTVRTNSQVVDIFTKALEKSKFQYFRDALGVVHRDLALRGSVTCGCAAGVVASFRAPLSGVLFSLEEKLGEGVKGVYISVDLDCMDSAFAPRESHTELGSLSFHDVLNIRHNLQADVVGADVVEFNPQRDTVDGMTAMVAAKLVRELTAKISK
ncbi:hypothetical protein FXO38_15778 [Capsicum annuum]|nr:hypothetical protein FXO38_15778 [Capsicum annuum]